LQNIVIRIEDFYFMDLPSPQNPDEPGSSLAQERRKDLCLVLRLLITAKSAGARMNIVLYATPVSPAEEADFELSILRIGVELLLPILGELQKTSRKINLAMTGFYELRYSPLLDWPKDLPYVGDCSGTEFLAINESLFRVGRLNQIAHTSPNSTDIH
jgi:hypothetical protein